MFYLVLLMILTFLVFRFRDTANAFDASSKRYVITNPPTDFTLLPSDQVKNNLRQGYKYNFYLLNASHREKYIYLGKSSNFHYRLRIHDLILEIQ